MYPISMEYNTKTGETTFVYREIPDKAVADFFLGAYERDKIKQRDKQHDVLTLNLTGKKV
jgi:hypothetical protein